jgi:hypothetical protein
MVLVFMALTAVSLFSQSYYGGVRGIVRDPNGGVVPNAKVTLTDEATKVARETTTGTDGEYVFNLVIPGTYTVAAEVKGFKKYERAGVIIGTQEQVGVDLTLALGEVTQTIEVTAQAPLIETEGASQGQNLDTQKLADLPNIGRNPFIQSKIAQNVVQYGNPYMNRMEDQSSTANVSIAGSIGWVGNYLIDGVPVSDWAGRPSIIPSIEAVQEVKVMENTYDAEMARQGGFALNTIVKSGTDLLHGAAYGSIRRNSMDANSFFDNAQPGGAIPLGAIPNDDLAFNIGGPVYIPHVYNGKNKTFWFVAGEGYEDGTFGTGTMYVPTAAEKQGDFSHSVTATGVPLTIYDPLTTVLNPDGTYTRTAFPGAVIPTGAAGRINTVGQNIANGLPPPTSAPSYYGDPDYIYASPVSDTAREYIFKADENFTNWYHASASYLHCMTLEPGQPLWGGPSASNDWALWRKEDVTTINNLFTISPTTVLAVRYGFNRFPNWFYTNSERNNFDPATLGFPTSLTSQMMGFKYPIIGFSVVTSGNGMSNGNGSLYNLYSNTFGAMLSHSRGRHSLKGGFDFRRLVVTGDGYGDESGSYSFNGVFTQSSPTSPLPGSGADLADLLLGYPASGTLGDYVKLDNYTHYYGAFFQDDFRVSSKLTVNLGIRWEHELGFREAQNRLYVNFDQNALNPLAANILANPVPGAPVIPPPRGVVEWAGQGGNPIGVGDPTSNKFSPRLGIAYQIDHKTVIRAGYGLVWGPQSALGGTFSPAGFGAETTYIASNNGFATPANSLSNPFPQGILKPVGLSAGSLTAEGQGVNLWDPKARGPYIEQYSVDIQRELPFGIAFQVGYLGTRGSRLPMNLPLDYLNPINFSMGASALNSSVLNPFYGNGGIGVIGGQNINLSQLLLPFPTYQSVTFSSGDYNHSLYNSLVVKAQKRLSNGLTFLTTLTWAQSDDLNSSGNTMMGGPSGLVNPLNLGAEWSRSMFNVPLVWSTAFTYQLPFGKGKPFANSSKALDYVVGGWQLNGIALYREGFPTAITLANNLNGAYGLGQRPIATGTSPETSGSLEDRLLDYINPAAFATPAQFTFGNVSRYITMRGPGMANWDLSMFKSVPIYERLTMQFRAEAMNAFNTTLFNGPSSSFGPSNPGFGQITSQANSARQMQLCLRLLW